MNEVCLFISSSRCQQRQISEGIEEGKMSTKEQ